MLFRNSKVETINDLLQRIGRNFQLDNSKINKIEQTYKSLSDWITSDKKFWGVFDTIVYPQGSYPIRTSLKPYRNDEFDLDFVVQALINYKEINPALLYNSLYNRLFENEIYKDKIEKKNRCIRINYKSDYHVDILPACLVTENNQSFLKIPDRELKDWCDSNPKGYIKWFNDISQTVGPMYFELKKAFEVEDLPAKLPYENLLPLQRAVQLMKRYRDVYFEKNSNNKPSSIIITTLAAMNYQSETSEYDTINNILSRVVNSLESIRYYGIVNPLNPKENFADKMLNDNNLFIAFSNLMQDFKNSWSSLNSLEGLDKISTTLSKLFGEKVVQSAINEYSEFINKGRENSSIGVNPARGNVITPKVSNQPFIIAKPNTNFGDV